MTSTSPHTPPYFSFHRLLAGAVLVLVILGHAIAAEAVPARSVPDGTPGPVVAILLMDATIADQLVKHVPGLVRLRPPDLDSRFGLVEIIVNAPTRWMDGRRQDNTSSVERNNEALANAIFTELEYELRHRRPSPNLLNAPADELRYELQHHQPSRVVLEAGALVAEQIPEHLATHAYLEGLAGIAEVGEFLWPPTALIAVAAVIPDVFHAMGEIEASLEAWRSRQEIPLDRGVIIGGEPVLLGSTDSGSPSRHRVDLGPFGSVSRRGVHFTPFGRHDSGSQDQSPVVMNNDGGTREGGSPHESQPHQATPSSDRAGGQDPPDSQKDKKDSEPKKEPRESWSKTPAKESKEPKKDSGDTSSPPKHESADTPPDASSSETVVEESGLAPDPTTGRRRGNGDDIGGHRPKPVRPWRPGNLMKEPLSVEAAGHNGGAQDEESPDLPRNGQAGSVAKGSNDVGGNGVQNMRNRAIGGPRLNQGVLPQIGVLNPNDPTKSTQQVKDRKPER